MLRLRKSSIAERDLLSIWEHIAQDNPTAADQLWRRLEERFALLRKNPFMGESQDRYRPGLRSIAEGSYIVFYEPGPDEILIYRILHGARRWEELL
jgi:toxin ParE1/3/4